MEWPVLVAVYPGLSSLYKVNNTRPSGECHWEVVVSPQGDWAKKQPVIQQLHKIMLMVIDDICSGLSSQGVGRTPLTSWRQGWGGGEGWH